MAGRVPKSRVARGGKLGRLAAEQAVRGAGTRISMIGRSDRARAILAERSTMQAAEQLVMVLGTMKGAAMKIGQMLSVLDLDLIPESHREVFREKLAALRDQAPAAPFSAMRKVIETDLGPLRGVFRDFDESAIAAASVGQVYRATLRDGRAVAVKVQYPGVDDAIRADMRNLKFFGKLAAPFWPTLKDNSIFDEIARNLESELDYEAEARTQHAVSQRYQGHPFITIPDSVVEHSSPHVLVTEFFDGMPFDRMRALPKADRNHIGELIYRFYIGSMFSHNEFCGDPHPGNVLVGADGMVAFIDFGLYNRMDPVNVDFERALLRAACEEDADELYRLMVGRGIVDPTSNVIPAECLDYLRSAAGWHLLDEPLTITPELATGALILAIDPRASAAQFTGIRRQQLPAEHVFSRRADFFTFGVLGQLNSTNNWHRIAREWAYGDPPATDIGRAIAEWRTATGNH
ncbi:AarF/UbiB family protein [Antrihabitans stalactiti]|uniref:AarF/ABC1/UbiB kinase family protein n=1 Tax=Antrihabitans stalactiti TaxID=2584121 RepID=A0A848K9B5_9NOCA|nr:AarF/ABC1/UbiB kinase family protein [Antrihabitans stalactiti]